MKPQDIILTLLAIFLLWKNNKNITTSVGMVLLVIAIPLFATHVFFTAEHLVYFGVLYFLIAAIQATIQMYANRN